MLTSPLTEAELRPIPETATPVLLQLASSRLEAYGVGIDVTDMSVVAIGMRRGQRIVHIDPKPEKTHWRGVVPLGYPPIVLDTQLQNVELLLTDDSRSEILKSLSAHLAYTDDLTLDIHSNAVTVIASPTNLLYRGSIRVPFRFRAIKR